MTEFKKWPSIPRYKGVQVTITEKMDGSNGCIVVQDGVVVAVQSRNTFITTEQDNYGFARWVEENKDELAKLGDGYHYGEWVGPGIQKNPHKLEEKCFFLFNSFRWGSHNPNTPSCCKVVPIIYQGPLPNLQIIMENLKVSGEDSGYEPEGIVIFYHNLNSYEKMTFKNPEGKWKSQ